MSTSSSTTKKTAQSAQQQASKAAEQAQAQVGEQITSAVNAGRETVEAAVKVGNDMASKSYEQAMAMTKDQVEAVVKAGSEVFKGYEDLVAYNKDNIEAVVQSGTKWVQGVQDLNKAWFGLAQTSMEETVNAAKAMMGCKNLQDVIKLQNDYARTNYDKLVKESQKLTDLSRQVAEEAFEPINARVSTTVEKFSKPLAA